MTFQFGTGVLNLPQAVLSHPEADAVQLRVLLWLASDLTLAQKPAQLAKLADTTQTSAKGAIAFWKTCGVLGDGEREALPVMAKPAMETPKKLLQRADELPTYTSKELADLLESRLSVRTMIDEAQQLLGKIFNVSEVNILVGMLDYLGMSEECVLMLLSYCRNIGKINLRSIEKTAYQLVDRGITEPAAMEEEIRTLEALHSFEGEVRRLFGMKSRSLTTRESKMLRAWASFGYDIDIVRLAYEMTVNATNEASLPYANSIIERWNAEGLHTLEAIEQAELAQKQKKTAAKSSAAGNVLGNSFDTDDFLAAALRRSFSDEKQN